MQPTKENTTPSNEKTETKVSVIQVKEYTKEPEASNLPTVSAFIASKAIQPNDSFSNSVTHKPITKQYDTKIVKESLPEVVDIYLATSTNPTVSDISKLPATAVLLNNIVESFEEIEIAPVLVVNDIPRASSQEIQLTPPETSTIGMSCTGNVIVQSISNR